MNVDNIEPSLKDIEEIDVEENVKDVIHVQIETSAVNNTTDTEKQKELSVSDESDTADASLNETGSDYETADSDIEERESKTDNLAEKFTKLTCNPADLEIEGESEDTHIVDNILAPVSGRIVSENGSDTESLEDEDNEDDDDDEESSWITPGKLGFTN